MPHKEPNNQQDFLIEKIKTRPINRRKLIRRTIITVIMAVIFGTVACVTFLILEPVISNRLYQEKTDQEQPQTVTFPEDQEEMSPEDMLAENIPTEGPSLSLPSSPSPSDQTPAPPEGTESSLTEDRLREILAGKKLDVKDYIQLYDALQDIIYEDHISEDGSDYQPALYRHIVTIHGVTSSIDWFDDIQESSNLATGVIVADNGIELLILVDYSSLEKAENLVLELGDGNYRISAQLKSLDKDTNLAIVAVERNMLPASYLEVGGLAVAPLGSSIGSRLVGSPVIALGSPMGINGSIGYGIITSADTQLTGPDRNYRLLLTDISGSRNAEGVLFNLKGQLIGIITNNRFDGDMENMINAYGITELRRIIEKLSNATAFAYMGITGTDVPQYVHNELNVPYGAYVTRVEMESPAMLAGIQVGDVITSMNGSNILSFSNYCSQLMRLDPEQTVQLSVRRQSQGIYREMRFSITLGEL